MKSVSLVFLMFVSLNLFAQIKVIEPDLERIDTSQNWVLHNRELRVENGIYLNAMKNDGLLWLKGMSLKKGTINLDIKGQDIQGASFVGIAFHGLNDSVYDAVYFRPFNFNNPDRNSHSVQYISHPTYTWWSLRKEFAGKYENTINQVPEPNNWFHVSVELNYPVVKVFVNNATEPSFVVEQLSERKEGWIGFWVGNGSEGSFKNLKIKQVE